MVTKSFFGNYEIRELERTTVSVITLLNYESLFSSNFQLLACFLQDIKFEKFQEFLLHKQKNTIRKSTEDSRFFRIFPLREKSLPKRLQKNYEHPHLLHLQT